jgi:hypothetical protein
LTPEGTKVSISNSGRETGCADFSGRPEAARIAVGKHRFARFRKRDNSKNLD